VTSVERRGALTRAAADLARGHTHAAIQRLRSLLVADPSDLAVRTMLARAYRQAGNLVEAGRWAYLTDELRPDEEAAFLRAYPSSWLRLRSLRYPGDPHTLAPEPAARLRRLVIAAHLAGPPRLLPAEPARPPERRHGTLFPCLYVIVILTAAAALAVIGAVRVWDWWVNL
jgi:Tetratricopeptide repeat